MTSKQDGSAFSEEEQIRLTKELNSLFKEGISWELENVFSKVIVVKAKNYIMQPVQGKLVIKGSGLKGSTKEKRLQQFMKDVIDDLLKDGNNLANIYNGYVKEIMSITDMTEWCTRKTLTANVLNAKRSNEQKVLDAIKGTEYVEGDRFYTFFKEDESLCLLEHFDGEYNKQTLLGKLHETGKIFQTVVDYKRVFPNLTLKRSQKLLSDIVGI